MIKGHGGNIYAMAREQNCPLDAITDMSSNVNPLGTLPGLAAHLGRKLDAIESLPEADADTISTMFAEHCGVQRENVAPGNGSTQLLYALPRALATRRALIVGPTYADYASACLQQRITPDYLLAVEADRFRLNIDRLSSAAPDYDTVFICNPNNPTGNMLPPEELAQIFAAAPDTVFIVDESYLPFAQTARQNQDQYGTLPNVVRMTSMSKIFKIPGLRIGFAIARSDIISRLQRFAMPWSVNSLACEAVTYVLQNESAANAFVKETQTFLVQERNRILSRFAGNPHVEWCPSCTSFLLACLKGDHRAKQVCAELARHLVLIRDCSNFMGLTDRHIRASLKSTGENQRFGDLLAELLEPA